MNNASHPGSRQCTCLSGLIQRLRTLRSAGPFLFFCYLLLLPVLPGSCSNAPPAATEEQEPPVEPAVDSISTRLSLSAPGPVKRLDLFIYNTGGTQPLELHRRLDSLPANLTLMTTTGEKRVVCIANSPRDFNLGALGRFDAMQQLAYSFADDNPERPVMGAWCETTSNSGTLVLKPLLCQVILASVANTMDGYELLESPRVRLCDIPDTAEILREQEFRPSELIDSGAWTDLGCDIGYFPKEPRITLWCYPNDTPENILGTPRPTLELECRIQGENCSFEVPLPPLERGSVHEVSITIGGRGDHRYQIR